MSMLMVLFVSFFSKKLLSAYVVKVKIWQAVFCHWLSRIKAA